MPLHESYRSSLIQSGYTPDQLNIIDAHLDATYYGTDEHGGDLYEYHDNLRIARVDNATEVADYEERKDTGCCGFYDREIEHPDGNILIGFNYGH